jgi:hypothetical protein
MFRLPASSLANLGTVAHVQYANWLFLAMTMVGVVLSTTAAAGGGQCQHGVVCFVWPHQSRGYSIHSMLCNIINCITAIAMTTVQKFPFL